MTAITIASPTTIRANEPLALTWEPPELPPAPPVTAGDSGVWSRWNEPASAVAGQASASARTASDAWGRPDRTARLIVRTTRGLRACPALRVRLGRFRAKRGVFGTDSAWQRHGGSGTGTHLRRALGRIRTCS